MILQRWIDRRTSDLATTSVDVVQVFLSGKMQTTIDGYRRDLLNFARHLGVESIDDGAKILLGQGQGEANAIVLDYRNRMLDKGLAASTINRRMSAIKSLVKMSRMMGLVSFVLDVPGVKPDPVRDTKGPGLGVVRDILAAHRALPDTPKNRRNMALFRMLFDLGLRRAEAAAIRCDDLDMESGTVAVLGKGRRKKQKVTLPMETRQALAAWLEVHEGREGLFYSLGSHQGATITGSTVWRIVQAMGRRAGIEGLRPHQLRHTSITTALDLTGGDVRSVRSYSRHSSIEVLMEYDDGRKDVGGEIAGKVAAAAG